MDVKITDMSKLKNNQITEKDDLYGKNSINNYFEFR